MHTNPNISITLIHTKKIITLKSALTNLKMSRPVFLLISFFKYLKKRTYESENT